METKFNFNSSVCTSREQSERLLALGLKKETADMIHVDYGGGNYMIRVYDWLPTSKVDMEKYIPAWSLHRLMSLMPRIVEVDGRVYGCMMELGGSVQYINLVVDKVIWTTHYNMSNLFDGLISCIEWLIKEGYFPKEYLV